MSAPGFPGYPRFGIRYSDGSLSTRFNGTTAEQRCRQEIAAHDAWVQERRPGPISPVNRVELVTQTYADGPWEPVDAIEESSNLGQVGRLSDWGE